MKRSLPEEILKESSKIPLECQEKILDIARAMAFTNKIVKQKNKPQQTA